MPQGHLPALNPDTFAPYKPTFRNDADRTANAVVAERPDDVPQPGRLDLRRRVQRVRRLRRPRRPLHRAARGRRGDGEIYKAWVDLGIDGFRIDTVKHVNMEFWKSSARTSWPAPGPSATTTSSCSARSTTACRGHEPVHDCRTAAGHARLRLPERGAVDFAKGSATTKLRDFFASDDWYTDTDSNVYETPTFLGNHDMGRVAMMLGKNASGDELMKRSGSPTP